MLDKIQFQNGSIVTEDFLNETQKGSSFSATTDRADYYSEPTAGEHSGWKIGQRDRLKDWEIADPRKDNETAIGRLAHDGIVLNSYNPNTLEKVWGPPALIETNAGSGVYGVWVEAGSVILSDGLPVSWSTQFVQLLGTSEINYIYLDEEGAKTDISDGEGVTLSIGPSLPSASNPHVPLAKITLSPDGVSLATDEDGSVVGAGYVDLRPSLYVGNLNTYPRILRNTSIKTDSYAANSWERVIADTSNGSLIVSLPESPTDSDRIAIVDISGTFDRFPIVIRPGNGTKISNSVDDWIINIRDAHVELFYHAATLEWKFEETPGGDCAPILGSFLSCGGREYIGTRMASECVDGQVIPPVYPNAPDGVYRYEPSTSKCYKEFYSSVAVYADGQGGLIKVQDAPRCNKSGGASSPSVKNIIYVDPAVGDDSISNNGFDNNVPFRSIERAIIQAVRESRRAGLYNDRYDKVVIELAPGDYYVDNSPGSGSIPGLTAAEGLIQRVPSGFEILNIERLDRATIILVDSLSPSQSQPPRVFNLGRILYSQSGGVGNIVKIEKESFNSSIWKITLEYVRGNFSPNDQLFYDSLSLINPTGGGIVIPRGVSVNGVDLRKVRVRPMYVPELNPVQNEAQREKTSIFKVTGGSYVSLITFTDNPQIPRSHNTVTSVGFASQSEMFGTSSETSYYSKINSLFGQYDNWGADGLEAIQAETTIVAPIYDSKNLRQTDSEENQTGIPGGDSRTNAPIVYPGATRIKNQSSSDQRVFDLPDINSTRSSSPYIFNCSVRSIFGLNGLHADGALVAGFRSMVTANFTQVSLQTDPTCFNDESYYLDPPVNKEDGVGKKYRPCPADPLKYRHFGFKGSNNATIQIVSCFVIGNADHFVSESGADLSITNSCSDFGDISLHSIGYKPKSFSQDEKAPAGTYGGTRILEIIPPKPLRYTAISGSNPATLVDTQVNTGLVLNYDLTSDYYKNAVSFQNGNVVPPALIRVYIRIFGESTPPSAEKMGFGQFTYTHITSDGSYVLSGGAKASRKRVFMRGFSVEGDPISYCGELQVAPASSPGFSLLDEKSKIFIWDASKSSWYFNVKTDNVVEEATDLDGDGYLLKKLDKAFEYVIIPEAQRTTLQEQYAQLALVADGSTIVTVRTLDKRKNDERVYRVVLSGFIRDQGLRRPQNFYILEKQIGVNGYPINGSPTLLSDPLAISQIRDWDEVIEPENYKKRLQEKRPSDGRFIAYLTQASQARRVITGEIYPEMDFDEPENTADPENSVTKRAIVEMQARPGFNFSKGIEPSETPISLKESSNSSSSGILIGLRRPSVIRASGHTWEWTGYLNYDTAFPTFQGEPLEQEFALGKIIVESNGGKVYATGMNEEGNFYIGTTVFDLRSGEQFAIPLEADNEPGSVTNQVFNSIVVKSSLLLGDGNAPGSLYFGQDTKIYFDPSTTFNTITGKITAESRADVYATLNSAGLVQLADDAVIRGTRRYGSTSGNGPQTAPGISAKAVITAASLAKELNARFDSSLSAADASIEVTSQTVTQGTEDPNDDTLQFAIKVKDGGITSAKIANSDITFKQNVYIGEAGGPVSSGNLYVRGDIYAFYTSDERLKDNVVRIPSALDKVLSLSGNTFEWNEKSGRSGEDVGVIAQEVQRVLPQAVIQRDSGYLAVGYEKLIPLLIEAVKELKQEVEDLKNSK